MSAKSAPFSIMDLSFKKILSNLSLLTKVITAPSFDQPWHVRRGTENELELSLFAHHRWSCLRKKRNKEAKVAIKYQTQPWLSCSKWCLPFHSYLKKISTCILIKGQHSLLHHLYTDTQHQNDALTSVKNIYSSGITEVRAGFVFSTLYCCPKWASISIRKTFEAESQNHRFFCKLQEVTKGKRNIP